MYLNEIYWGQANGKAICGAEMAAQTYFGKTVEQLSLAESATLAGIISAPNTYNPLRSPEKAEERRDIALMRMEQTGAITARQHRQARRSLWPFVPLKARDKHPTPSIPFWIGPPSTWARNLWQIRDAYREYPASDSAEKSLKKPLRRAWRSSTARFRTRRWLWLPLIPTAGASSRWLAAGTTEQAPSIGLCFARRQLGSTIKPLTLLSVFESEPTLSPATLIEDSPIQRDSPDGLWEPKNHDGRFRGLMSLREAVATSRNIPAVLMAERLGHSALQSFLHRIGLDEARSLPSTALGAFRASPLEIARAYSLFANGGALPEIRIIDQISVPTHRDSQATSEAQWNRIFENPLRASKSCLHGLRLSRGRSWRAS